MSFSDIFKSSFLEKTTSVSVTDMAITIGLAFVIGLLIFFVYKKTFRGVMYSSSFGVTLIALTMITSVLILAVTSNVVLSLGMVGALSIVRFRTAIKEPLDIAFLFWSIAAGIILASGLFILALVGSIIIGVVLLVFVNKKSHKNPFILVLSCADDKSEKDALETLKSDCAKYEIKSKSVREGLIELNIELRLKSESTDFVNRLQQISGVNSATLVSYNGEYMG